MDPNDKVLFHARKSSGDQVCFSLAEYLAWRARYGMPIQTSELNLARLKARLGASNDNEWRIDTWLALQTFRKEHPNNPAVAYMRQHHRYSIA